MAKRERLFNRIAASLEDALAFSRGDHSRARLYTVVGGKIVEVSAYDSLPSDSEPRDLSEALPSNENVGEPT